MDDAPSQNCCDQVVLAVTNLRYAPLSFERAPQVDQIRLIYSGKQLADNQSLSFYNVAAGGTIHMVLQLRGGAAAIAARSSDAR